VTLKPRFYGDIAEQYFPKSYTISEWGDYKVDGVDVAIEFKAYQTTYKIDHVSLSVTQV